MYVSPVDTPYPNVNLLLGNNGSGKSSVLQSIALGVLSRVMTQSGFVPYQLIRRQSPGDASIDAELVLQGQDDPGTRIAPGPLTGTANFMTRIVRSSGPYEQVVPQEGPFPPGLSEEHIPTYLLVGYGATRRVETGEFCTSAQAKNRRPRYQRVVGLFEDGAALVPLQSWLDSYRLSRPHTFNVVVDFINKFLPDEMRFRGDLEADDRPARDRDFLFELRNQPVPFPALSDGYKAYIGWVADLAYHLSTIAPDAQDLSVYSGVLLIDEIDLHLHPEWQLSVIDSISRALPNMQLVCSTHSPIVAGTLKLRRKTSSSWSLDDNGAVTVKQLDERVYGLNATKSC